MSQDLSTAGAAGERFPDEPISYADPQLGTTDDSTKDVAKDQAAQVGQSAAEQGQHVAQVAKDEAGNVAQEAKAQTKDLLGQARQELTQQASAQQERVATGLRSLSRELGSMAQNSEEPGYASDLARQASSTVDEVAGWFENRDPGGVLDEVRSFARRRPGAFLAMALGAGVVAGRLTRGIKDDASSDDAPTSTASVSSTPSVSRYAAPTASPYATPHAAVVPASQSAAGDLGYGTSEIDDDLFAAPAVERYEEPIFVEEPSTGLGERR